MKKLFTVLAIALCLTSYSSPLSAKENKNTEITLITDDNDTIICESAILDKYGLEKIIEAYKKEKIMCDSVVVTKNVIPIKEHTIVYLSLIKEGNKVTEFVSSPITRSEVNWLAISCLSGIFILFIVFYISYVRLYLPSKR